MNNPFKEARVFTATDREFNKFVQYHYGQEFEFAADWEAYNDTTHEFEVTIDPLDAYDQEKITRFYDDGTYQSISGLLLNDLCRNGVIAPGKYIIDVSW